MDDAAQSAVRPRGQRRGRDVPTVADVARLAGVSPMTVSRIINGVDKVSPDTRAKVEAAIATLNYVPNQAARSLAGGQQFRIGLLHSNPSAAYLSEFLVGSLAEASRRNAQLIVEHSAQDEAPTCLVARLRTHRIDAVLLPPPLCDDGALLEVLHAAGLVVAQVATGRPLDFAVAVTIADETAAHEVTTRLIALGHRRIGFIAGPANQAANALREAGYRRAMADAGMFDGAEWCMAGDFTYRGGLVAATALLQRAPRPTAIFASNDDMAAAAVAVAHRMGLDVPRDLSVCGFDDTALATTIWPELTTVHQPIAEMACMATRLLIERLTTGNEAEAGGRLHYQLNHRLMDRGTDASPTIA